MKRLLVLRHAKSSWDGASLADWTRPLSARGERDAPRIGVLLRDRSLMPDIIITSDAVRAHTTARAVAKAAGYAGTIVVEPSLYHADPDEVLALLKIMSDERARAVLIVGHNPGLEDLIEQLTGERHDLPTAALVHLTLPIDRWREIGAAGGATVVDIWRPKDLAP